MPDRIERHSVDADLPNTAFSSVWLLYSLGIASALICCPCPTASSNQTIVLDFSFEGTTLRSAVMMWKNTILLQEPDKVKSSTA